MVGREDNLFQNFRLPWVPAWVPDWVESGLRNVSWWKWLLLASLMGLGGYGGIRWGATSAESSGDVAAWRQQLDQATRADFPLLLDGLFQVPDDRVFALGLESFEHPDHERRSTAGLVLQDAVEKWERWSPREAGRQWQRLLAGMADSLDRWHAPEQALAVHLAERGLTRPFPADPEISTAILSSARQILAQANPAHTREFRWELASGGRDDRGPQGWSADTNGAEGLRSAPRTFSPVVGAAGDGDRGQRRGANPDMVAGSPSGRGTPWQQAGFSAAGSPPNPATRPPSGMVGLGGGGAPLTGRGRPSEVPLFDDQGRLIEVMAVDPETFAAPGGLIPVEMSGTYRARRAPAAAPAAVEGPEVSVDPAPIQPEQGTSRDGSRVGPSRVAPRAAPRVGPSDEPNHVADAQRLELEAAVAQGQRAIVASRPAVVGAPVDRGTLRQPPGLELNPEPRPPSSGGVRALEIATSGNSRLPANPYRADSRPAGTEPVSRSSRRMAAELSGLNALSHIEVIQRLGDADPDVAGLAVQELRRRGFDANDIAVSRRLISPDAAERYQLVLDLMGSNRVEPTPFLRWLTGDVDPEVRAIAAEALEMLQAAGRNRAVDASPGNRRNR